MTTRTTLPVVSAHASTCRFFTPSFAFASASGMSTHAVPCPSGNASAASALPPSIAITTNASTTRVIRMTRHYCVTAPAVNAQTPWRDSDVRPTTFVLRNHPRLAGIQQRAEISGLLLLRGGDLGAERFFVAGPLDGREHADRRREGRRSHAREEVRERRVRLVV